MRTDLWSFLQRFSQHQVEILGRAFPRDAKGRGASLDPDEPRTFHLLCVGLALYRSDFPIVNLPASMTDGLGDFSLDAIALMFGSDPIFSPEEAEEALQHTGDGQSLSVLFVQAKREAKIDEKEVIDFGAKIVRFLTYSLSEMEKQLRIGEEGRAQDAAQAVLQYWRAYDVMRNVAKKLEIHAVYAYAGDFKAPPGVIAAAKDFEHNVKMRLPQADAAMTFFGADELLAIGQEADADVARQFKGVTLLELPPTTGASSSFTGFIGGQHLVDAIRARKAGRNSRDRHPDSRLFFDNPRAFLNTDEFRNAGVVSLRKTLADRALHDRIILGHNGLLITGDTVTREGSTLDVHGAQILNGLQSCYALFEYDGRLQGVHVPIKVFATTDELLKDALILASNTQQAFGEYDMLSRKRDVRNLQPDFEAGSASDLGHLWLQLKPAEPPRGQFTKNLTPRHLMDAFVAAYLGEPHEAHAKAQSVRDRVEAGEIFSADDEPSCYRALGWLVVRGRLWAKASGKWQWHDRFDHEGKSGRVYPARHQFTYALWRIASDAPDDPQRGRSPDTNRRFERVIGRLMNDRTGIGLAKLAAQAIDAACGTRPLTQALARSSSFTAEVRTAADESRADAKRQGLL